MSDTAVAAPGQSSRWEDLLDAIFSPAELFRRRGSDSWLKAFGILVLASVVLYYVLLPANSLIWEAAMLQNAPAGADLERIRRGAAFMKWLGGLFVPFGLAFGILFTALGLKLGSTLLEPSATWRQAFTIATYSMFVVIPQQVLTALVVMIKSRSSTITMHDASFGVLRFLEPGSVDRVMSALFGRFDLFALWSAVLCAVGLVVVVGMPRTKAALTAAISWALVALPSLAGAALSGGR